MERSIVSELEKSTSSLLYSDEMFNLLKGSSNPEELLILQGFYLTLEKAHQVEQMLVFDAQGKVVLHERSGSFSPVKSDFEIPSIRTMMDSASKSFQFESSLINIADQARLFIVTSITDDDDKPVGFLGLILHPNVEAEYISRVMGYPAAFCRNNKFINNKFDTLFQQIPEDKKFPKEGRGRSILFFDKEQKAVRGYISPVRDYLGDIVVCLWVAKPENQLYQTQRKIDIAQVGIALLLLALTLLIIWKFVSRLLRPLDELGHASRQIAEGDLDTRIEESSANDEIGVLIQSFQKMLQALKKRMEITDGIASGGGDFSVEVELFGERDHFGQSLQKLLYSLNEIIGTVKQSVQQVSTGSSEVQSNTQQLMTDSNDQRQLIQNIITKLEELASASRSNIASSTKGTEIASLTQESAERNGQKVHELAEKMTAIDNATQKITQIIKVIDEIAFQTNLLALNAAVEAARAGHHGKGFAVVAEEVRSLATRSAKAASETTSKIEDIVSLVKTHSQELNKTSEEFSKVVQASQSVNAIMQETGKNETQLNSSISEIQEELKQISHLSEQGLNKLYFTEETVSNFHNQLIVLNNLIGRFKLKENARGLKALN
jgi:methyl-accepting chemotaxis protein